MIGGFLLLAIAVFGLSVLFGKGKIEDYLKFAVWLIFAPVLFAIGINHVEWLWLGLPLWMQVLTVLLAPFFAMGVLLYFFPKAKWLRGLLEAVFQFLIYLITFPVRLVWRAGKFLLQKERSVSQLDSHKAVVGSKPPLKDQQHRRNNPSNSKKPGSSI